MVLFVWGKETLPQENFPLGMQPSQVVKEIGFEKGDKIINVDGKVLDNVLEINTMLLFRPIEYVTVQKSDGSITEISIPSNLGNDIFKSGQIRSFDPVILAEIDSVIPGSPALSSGLQSGDKILSVNDDIIDDWSSFSDWMDNNSDDIINVVVDRNNLNYNISIDRNDDGTIGVYPAYNFKTTNQKLGLIDSVIQGFDYGYWILYDYVSGFQYIVTKQGAQQLGGFGTIGIILAFMNVLPIPALDGGHVMFLIYEMVTGKKLSDKFMETATMIGFFLLIALVLYANGNDLFRFLNG